MPGASGRPGSVPQPRAAGGRRRRLGGGQPGAPRRQRARQRQRSGRRRDGGGQGERSAPRGGRAGRRRDLHLHAAAGLHGLGLVQLPRTRQRDAPAVLRAAGDRPHRRRQPAPVGRRRCLQRGERRDARRHERARQRHRPRRRRAERRAGVGNDERDPCAGARRVVHLYPRRRLHRSRRVHVQGVGRDQPVGDGDRDDHRRRAPVRACSTPAARPAPAADSAGAARAREARAQSRGCPRRPARRARRDHREGTRNGCGQLPLGGADDALHRADQGRGDPHRARAAGIPAPQVDGDPHA